MKISFYYVDKDYIDYLKEIEVALRGFTTIPNMEYHLHNKFVYGVVLNINDTDYYVPFSHYDKQQEDNILIKVDYHKKIVVAGSLRFNYMFPVPKKCLILVDFVNEDEKRRVLLRKEYKSCLRLLSQIKKKAAKTYDRVINHMDDELILNSCMFLDLEEACKEYESCKNAEAFITKQRLYENALFESIKQKIGVEPSENLSFVELKENDNIKSRIELLTSEELRYLKKYKIIF